MFARYRGTTYLAERSDTAITGPSEPVCQSALSIALATEKGTIPSKCGPFDSIAMTYIKALSGTLTLEYDDVDDKNFARGVLGKVVAAGVSPLSVSGEILPLGMGILGSYWLGGLTTHTNITSLVVHDAASPSPTPLVANTDYQLDPVSGELKFLNDLSAFQQPLSVNYSHRDAGSVPFLVAAQKQYSLVFKNINQLSGNAPGKMELYNVSFDPSDVIDFLSDDNMKMSLKGTVLADPFKDVTDTDLGQYGRRQSF